MEKPRYRHNCPGCMFMGHHGNYDLYTCPGGSFPCCIARFGDEGSEYSSMSMEMELWDASLAAIDGPRQSMYHCYIPELCEVWRRVRLLDMLEVGVMVRARVPHLVPMGSIGVVIKREGYDVKVRWISVDTEFNCPYATYVDVAESIRCLEFWR